MIFKKRGRCYSDHSRRKTPFPEKPEAFLLPCSERVKQYHLWPMSAGFGGGVPAITHLLFTMAVIRLIGVPAPPAETHRRLHPLSQRSRSPFHPRPAPPSKFSRKEDIIIVIRKTSQVSFLRSHARSPQPHSEWARLRQVDGVSSRPRKESCNRPPAHRQTHQTHWPMRERCAN